MPGRGVLNRQIGILSFEKLSNDEKLIFTLFYWKNRKIGYPGAYARATVCVKNSRPIFKVWISALLAGVAPLDWYMWRYARFSGNYIHLQRIWLHM